MIQFKGTVYNSYYCVKIKFHGNCFLEVRFPDLRRANSVSAGPVGSVDRARSCLVCPEPPQLDRNSLTFITNNIIAITSY